MRIAGLERSSFVDYPGKLAAVLFTPGCNLDCFYCHNRHLLSPGEEDVVYSPEDVLDFLRRRVGLLEGVVVTGGEPTLQKDLEEFLAEIHSMGFAVKLDTNGTQPWVVQPLIEKRLVDFVAMDVKAPKSRYDEIAGKPVDISAVEESVNLLMHSRVDYEFRTTFAPQLTALDIVTIAAWIHGAKRYVLQQYRPPGLGVDMFGLVDSPKPRPPEYIAQAALLVRRFVRHIEVRGLGYEPDLLTKEKLTTPVSSPLAKANKQSIRSIESA
ncbi:MAG: anaerobic ribonucleoside-triphosphate reductase activating protein [Phycisphaerae bacterium]|nr:anaerobic ribonucleoside-triphosphate reductase activating protein [Phycisphaerae bacterium]